MSLRLVMIAACVLGGCASLSVPDLPVCDGRARRPANPHGSILSPDTAMPSRVTPAAPAENTATGGCA